MGQLLENILKEISRDLNEKEYCEQINSYLNSKITKSSDCSDFISKILINDNNPIESLINLIKDLNENIEDNYYTALIKAKSHNYKYLVYHDNKYYFDFSYLIDKYTKIEYFFEEINKLIKEIDNNRIVELLNELSYVSFIKSELDVIKDKFTYKTRAYIYANFNKFSLLKKPLPILFIWIVILMLFNIYGIYLIYVTPDTQQTISLSLLGALTSLLGFLVVFLQISFDNQKKILGNYAKRIIFDKSWNELAIIFTIAIISSLIAALSKNDIVYIRDILFNISISSFVVFLSIIIPKIKSILNNIVGLYEANKIVELIDEGSITNATKPIKFSDFIQDSLVFYESNPVAIINDIIRHNITQHEYKTARILLIQIADRYIQLLLHWESTTYNVQYQSRNFVENIIDLFVKTFGGFYERGLVQKSNEITDTVFESVSRLCFHVCVLKLDIENVKAVYGSLGSLVRKSSEQKDIMIVRLKRYDQCMEYLLEQYSPSFEDVSWISYSDNKIKRNNDSNYDNKYSRMWYTVKKIVCEDYFILVKYCSNQVVINEAYNLPEIYNIYRERLDYLTQEVGSLNDEQIKNMIPEFCSNTYDIYKDLKRNHHHKNSYTYNPFWNFTLTNLIKKERSFLYVYFNFWYMWNENAIMEKEIKGYMYSDVYNFIHESIIADAVNFKYENLFISAIGLYKDLFSSYEEGSRVTETLVKEIEIIERLLKEKNIVIPNINEALRDIRANYIDKT